jgi:hypothetical protein
MNQPIPPQDLTANRLAAPHVFGSALQAITALLLWGVLFAVTWMVLAASGIRLLRLPSLELEIIIVLALFVAALLMVSIVALQHTQSAEEMKE